MRRSTGLLIGAAAVLLAAAAVTTTLVLTGEEEDHRPPVLLATVPECPNIIVIDAETDAEMRVIAARIAADPRFTQYFTRTKAESLAQFKEIFADQPELVASAREEALPAIVMVKHGSSLDHATVVQQLQAEYPVDGLGKGARDICGAEPPPSR